MEAYKSDYRYRDRKIWDGKSFKGKCLLVHDDQGLGDTLQFVRYLPLVKKMGGTVILETRREIIPLLTEFPGIDLLLLRPPENPSNVKFDYYIPLLSIPGRMGTQHDSIPANIPYLYGETEKNDFWKEKMIRVVKMDGSPIFLNADWIQSVEATPDTVITLTNGFQLLVRDRVEEIVSRFKAYKRETQNLSLKDQT